MCTQLSTTEPTLQPRCLPSKGGKLGVGDIRVSNITQLMVVFLEALRSIFIVLGIIFFVVLVLGLNSESHT